MEKDSERGIVSSAKNFFYGTFFSRICGLFRDITMAFFWGAGSHIAAFMVAFRFANLFRRILGESTLQVGFIPYFESVRKEDLKSGAKFYRDTIFSLFAVLVLMVTILELLVIFFRRWVGADFVEILNLTMLIIPSLIFISMYALSSSVLHAYKSFFLPAIAPVAFNLVWIVLAIGLRGKNPEVAVIWLSIGIVIAFLFQWVVIAPSSFRYLRFSLSWKEWLSPSFFSKDFKQLIKPLSLSVIGVAAVQVNSALDVIFAKLADDRGPAFLWYSARLYQLPLALFGVAVARALLPSLARSYRDEQMEKFGRFLNTSLRQAVAVLGSGTLAILALGFVSINFLYGRGVFCENTTINTLYCLWGYGLGLLPSALVLMLGVGFYAKKEYLVPTFCSILAVMVNVVLNSLFVLGFGWHVSTVAIATSISAYVNFSCLAFYLSKKSGKIFDRKLKVCCFKTFFSAALAAILVIFVGYRFLGDPTLVLLLAQEIVSFPRNFILQISNFFTLTSLFFITLLSIAKFLKNEELLEFIPTFKSGVKKLP